MDRPSWSRWPSASWPEQQISVEEVRNAAKPLFELPGGSEIDTIVLACTHFPLLDEELRQAFPGKSWVDGGAGIARRIAYLTRGQPWPDAYPGGIALFTGDPPNQALLDALAGYGLTETARV